MPKSSGPEVECVLRRRSITGECPVWCDEEQALYWVDVQEPALHRFDPATGEDRSWTMPAWIGSFGLGAGHRAGSAVVALRTGVHRFDFASGTLDLLATAPFDSRRFFLNDGACDRQGRFWVGPMYRPLPPVSDLPEAERRGPLCRLDGRALIPATAPVGIANGLAWSPDSRTMYHADTADGVVFRYEFDPDMATLANRRVFVRLDAKEGGPDGAAVDRDGFYWIARFGGGRLARFDPNGKLEREIALPVRYPTMCAFGGADLSTLYVTSAGWALNDMERERHPLEGSLFALEAPVPGLPAGRWPGAAG